ncbi:MAG: hypothetical protein IPM47_13660 [Sphingobacteriales bacterium]|nr:MAG: hypothetical protein IPM47_13660 [Sphingobacteriales bacterium]
MSSTLLFFPNIRPVPSLCASWEMPFKFPSKLLNPFFYKNLSFWHKITPIYGLFFCQNDVAKDFDDLEKDFDDLEKSFDDLEKSFDDLEKSFDDLEKSFDDLEKSFDDLEKSFDDLEKSFDDLANVSDNKN